MKALPTITPLFFVTLVFTLLAPSALAHGGCVQPVGNLYVQLSSVPISPSVGEQASMILGFADANGVLQDNITATVRIKQEDAVVFEKSYATDSGLISLKPVFNKPGEYHLSVDFQRASQGSKLYQPEEFTIEVKPATPVLSFFITFFLLGVIVGYLFYKFAIPARVYGVVKRGNQEKEQQKSGRKKKR